MSSASVSSKQQAVSGIKSFTDLIAWQKGHELVVELYQITKSFPISERFGLTSQMRRAAVSVTSNIAEGFSRFSEKDKLHFYYMAQGSLTELQNQILIAHDVGMLGSEGALMAGTVEVHKLITGLIKSFRRAA